MKALMKATIWPQASAALLLAASSLLVASQAPVDGVPHAPEANALAEGDECSLGEGPGCALSALQQRGRKVAATEARTEEVSEGAATASLEAASAAEAERLRAQADAAEAAAAGLRALLAPQHRYNSSEAGARRAPSMATTYDGFEDRRHVEVQSDGSGNSHVFAIGDWGAVLPNHITATNKRGSGKCPEHCDYVMGIDDRAQILVANQMKRRAASSNPQYVLNVGDNFYWAGVHEHCGTNVATGLTYHDFSAGWQDVYGGLTSKPWISCLGNHDYGGITFSSGWPQQIAYSFVNKNWILPGRYYSKLMQHDGYSVEYFIIDTNAWDAMDEGTHEVHNICGPRNKPGASCAAAGGPTSVHDCQSWFWSSYAQQKEWLKRKLADSRADWKVVVTHFPCEMDAGYWRHLHEDYGLDLLVTGHRHDQELLSHSAMLGGMTCMVTGGGGGITSEHSTHGDLSSSQYGFFDITMSKHKMHIELIALSGVVIKDAWVYPKGA